MTTIQFILKLQNTHKFILQYSEVMGQVAELVTTFFSALEMIDQKPYMIAVYHHFQTDQSLLDTFSN